MDGRTVRLGGSDMSTQTNERDVEVVPAADGEAAQRRATVRRDAARALGKAVSSSLLTLAVTVVIVLALWIAAVKLTDVSPYVAKTPAQVWDYLFTVPSAGENRSALLSLLWVTLGHALVGFAAGLVVAIVGAVAFRLSSALETAFMPFALLLRSVPLIAMTPLIILIFGLGSVWSVAVIGGIVVLFPALVTIAFGLNSASRQMLDVVHVYGGSDWTAIRTVALPSALPSLFAAIRISVPGAITGALLAEWLSTGDGIGGSINRNIPQAQFAQLWASVALVTAVSVALYMVVQFLENLVLARMGGAD